MGSTKYAPVSNTGEDANNEVDNMKNTTKNTIISGQVRYQFYLIFTILEVFGLYETIIMKYASCR